MRGSTLRADVESIARLRRSDRCQYSGFVGVQKAGRSQVVKLAYRGDGRDGGTKMGCLE